MIGYWRKAADLVSAMVVHTPAFFEEGNIWNFIETTLFEVVTWDWRGQVLVVRHYEGDGENDMRPLVTWHWVHVKYIERPPDRTVLNWTDGIKITNTVIL